MEQKQPNDKYSKQSFALVLFSGLAVGVGVGIAAGIAVHFVAIGTDVGVGMGLAVTFAFCGKGCRKDAA
ncbi:MAG: hypothetical protein ABSE48_17585 [Verrucomicrobiota bacterium]